MRENVSCAFEILHFRDKLNPALKRNPNLVRVNLLAKNFKFFQFLDWERKMADLNEQDLLDYDEEEQEVKDIKTKKDVKVNPKN